MALDAYADPRMGGHDAIVTGGAQNIEVANAFLWLASPAAGWVSGQTFQIVGGGTRSRILPK